MLVFAILLLVIMIFAGVESLAGSQVIQIQGQVTGVEFRPASSTIVYEWIGKMMVPVVINHPPAYIVDVAVDGKILQAEASEVAYQKVKTGQTVTVKMTVGKMTKITYYIGLVEDGLR